MRTSTEEGTETVRQTSLPPATNRALSSAPAPTEKPTKRVVEPAPEISRATARSCRVLNFVVALLVLTVTSPLLLVIAVAVAVSSKGPIFFRQLRVGLDRRRAGRDEPHAGRDGARGRRQVDYGGRLFRIWKFRTMYVDTGPERGGWATPDDPRVTPIGRFLRKHRLDELPQLFNVLKGDMNIVGPRPEQPDIFVELREEIPAFPYRQRVLPGITGWAQINHHYGTTVDDMKRKAQLDLEYIEHRSVAQDLKIMWRTVPVMLFREGAW